MTSRLIVSLRVAATPARAFSAFTEDIALWWRPDPFFRFTRRSPGVLAFEGGEGGRFIETLPDGRVFEIGRITAWAPPHRLAFGWRQATFTPEQHTEVLVRFEPLADPWADQTRVTVEHLGWDSVPAGHVARHGLKDPLFLRRHGAWWNGLLAAFAETIT